MLIKDIISKIEKFAPVELASEWDNTGWQVKLDIEETDKVLLALSPTPDVVEQAKNLGCGLIVTHHPLFMGKITRLSYKGFTSRTAIETIRNNIQIYAAHTNLDKTQGGINDVLAQMFGLRDVEIVGEFVRTGTIEPMPLDDFALCVKDFLGCENVRLINTAGVQTVSKVALCSGSGADLVNSCDADVFITGDVKYHSAIEALDKAILDVGHFEGERVILPVLQGLLTGVETFIADEKDPWTVI